MEHNIEKQKSYLKEALSSDKRSIGIFIAAGCPLSVRVKNEPLIPDVAELTKTICNSLAHKSGSHLCRICMELAKSHNESPNIEQILSYVRSLKQIMGENEFLSMDKAGIENLEKEICNNIFSIVNKQLPNRNTSYHKLASWASAISRTEPITIFTTNYDLLLEQAFEEVGTPYFDGFIGSRKAFFDPFAMEEDRLPSRWVRLWKLHGSVNWYQDTDSHNNALHVWRGFSNENKMLIYPSHLKYDESRRMPYLAMIDQLRAFLKISQSVLFICGYSFNDHHINDVFLQGLRGNSKLMIFALLYGKLECYPHAILLAKEKYNISLLAKDKAIIGGRECKWATSENTVKEVNSTDTDEGFNLGDFNLFADFLEGSMNFGGQITIDVKKEDFDD